MQRLNTEDASAILASEPSASLIQTIVRVALRHRYPGTDCPKYFFALRRALREEPPPFATREYGLVYRSLSVEPRWMAVSLVTNAEREGDGAERLWSLAACSSDQEHRRLLKRHACDESRHALLYLALLNWSFPGGVSPEFRTELRQLSPGFSMRQELFPVEGSPYAKPPTLDDFLQMNIAEVRTAIHHTLQRPALAEHCPATSLATITKLHDVLLADELNHIAYTAVLIERGARDTDPDRLAGLFRRRFHDFNAITTEELGDNVFDCSVACCAKRPWCRAKATGAPPAPTLHQIGMNAHS